MENPCVVAFLGDRTIAEYTPSFEKRLAAEYPGHAVSVRDGGSRGATSREGLAQADALAGAPPQVAVVAFGAADRERGVPAEEFRANLAGIVGRCEALGARVVLATPHPDGQGGIDYARIVRETAHRKRVKTADVDSLWRKTPGPEARSGGGAALLNEAGRGVYGEALMHVVPRDHTVVLWQYNGRECACNYRCPYCYYASSDKSENLFWGTPGAWGEAFRKCFGRQKLYFYLAFGEPMLGASFHEVVEMIGEEPRWSLRITTNLSQDLGRLLRSRVAREGRLYVNASFHPTQAGIGGFLGQLGLLRRHGIDAPVVYVMWPPHLGRFESDFEEFDRNGYLVHVRRFAGRYGGMSYPVAYTDEERRFVARYCDDATIRYMLNEKPVLDRRSYSGMHFVIVDATGNAGYDSDCFDFGTPYRTILGNVIQHRTFRPSLEPILCPERCRQGTVDGVSNYLETGYRQLEGNNILSFARQGGVRREGGRIRYKHRQTDFADPAVREEYCFPPLPRRGGRP